MKRKYRALITGSLLALPLVALGSFSGSSSKAHADTLPISKIVQKGDQKGQDKNQVLEVRQGNTSNYQPFFYNGLQVRVDKLQANFGYNMNDITNAFKQAKRDGFTVVNSQILWSDVQPDVSLTPTDVAFIKSGNDANKNEDEKAQTLQLTNANNSKSQVLLKYDLRKIGNEQFQSGNFDGVKIRVYAKADQNANLVVNGIDKDDWDANATWNGTAGLRNSEKKVTVSPKYDPVMKENYYDLNVKDFVNSQNHGKVTLALSTEGNQAITVGGGKTFGTMKSPATKKLLNETPKMSFSKKDAYDFSYLDKVIGAARAAGIKMELLWFGSDTTKETTEKRVPTYATQDYQWAVDSLDNPVKYKKSDATSGMGQYNIVLDKNDPNLQRDEGSAISKTFNHLADNNAANGYTNTIIGSQLPNEPSTYSSEAPASKTAKANYKGKYDFNAWTLWNYTNNLDSHVKKSNYSVWTRVNNAVNDGGDKIVAINEDARKNGGTNIDAVGLDPYTYKYQGIYDYGHKGTHAQGENMPMVMEDGLGIAGSWAQNNYQPIDAAARIITSLAGGATHNYYDFKSGDGFDLYDSENADGTWKPHEMSAGNSAIKYIRDTNTFVNKLGYDLATKQADGAGGKNLLFFNAVPASGYNFSDTKQLGDKISVTYKTDTKKSMGIADKKDDNNILLGSTLDSDAHFTIKGLGKAVSVQSGQYKDAQSNEWVAGNDKITYTNNSDGTISVTVPKNTVVKVSNKTETPVKPTTPTNNGSSSTNNSKSGTTTIPSTPSTNTPSSNTNNSGSTNSGTTSTPTVNTNNSSKTINKVVYAVKGIKLYDSTVFKASNVLKSFPKAKRVNRPTFLATKLVTNKNGVQRYQVRVINAKGKLTSQQGYITTKSSYVKPAYYSTVPAKKTIKVIAKSGINSYKTNKLNGKVRHYKKNSILKVKKVVLNKSINRFQLTNGYYVTASKRAVMMN